MLSPSCVETIIYKCVGNRPLHPLHIDRSIKWNRRSSGLGSPGLGIANTTCGGQVRKVNKAIGGKPGKEGTNPEHRSTSTSQGVFHEPRTEVACIMNGLDDSVNIRRPIATPQEQCWLLTPVVSHHSKRVVVTRRCSTIGRLLVWSERSAPSSAALRIMRIRCIDRTTFAVPPPSMSVCTYFHRHLIEPWPNCGESSYRCCKLELTGDTFGLRRDRVPTNRRF